MHRPKKTYDHINVNLRSPDGFTIPVKAVHKVHERDFNRVLRKVNKLAYTYIATKNGAYYDIVYTLKHGSEAKRQLH